MSYQCHVIIDLEFNPVRGEKRKILKNEIIEIAAIKLDAAYRETDRFHCFVRPEWNCAVERKITELTGIRTEDVAGGCNIADALALFSEWVGEDWNRFYSWSYSDLYQLEDECWAKEIDFPWNIGHWTDLQRLYPRVMKLPRGRQLSLRAAIGAAGMEFDVEEAHRAMYDTEKTVEILRLFVSGAYKPIAEKNSRVFLSQVPRSTYCIGTAFGGVLDELTGMLNEQDCRMIAG